MLRNKKSSNTSRVKFISYTGEYPNLCSGVLTLEIDGVQYKFGQIRMVLVGSPMKTLNIQTLTSSGHLVVL